MTRLLLLCDRPSHLHIEDARAWLSSATAELAGSETVLELRPTELETASAHWARSADWLIEAELIEGAFAVEIAAEPTWAKLLGDLRLLATRPTLAIADPGRSTLPGEDG